MVNFRVLGKFDATARPSIISLSLMVGLQICLVGISGSKVASSFSEMASGTTWGTGLGVDETGG